VGGYASVGHTLPVDEGVVAVPSGDNDEAVYQEFAPEERVAPCGGPRAQLGPGNALRGRNVVVQIVRCVSTSEDQFRGDHRRDTDRAQ
jgi:hypothetical protein